MWSGDGEEWQHYILLLLKYRYGPDFVEIPDIDRGDYGLEGFSRKEHGKEHGEGYGKGYAFQCYFAENPLSPEILYTRQRDKISRDIKKFIDNKEALIKIFGPTKISHWILVVPRRDTKRLLDHTEKKAQEVRKLNLPYVADEFFVDIIDDTYFAAEREQLMGVGLSKTKISPDIMAQSTCSCFLNEDGNNELIENLERKIAAMYPWKTQQEKEKLKINFIMNYINGQNVLEKLHSDYPSYYMKAIDKKDGREEFLETECLTSICKPSEMLISTVDTYMQELSTELKGLDESTIRRLVHEAMADWLLRCPLNFSDYEVST